MKSGTQRTARKFERAAGKMSSALAAGHLLVDAEPIRQRAQRRRLVGISARVPGVEDDDDSAGDDSLKVYEGRQRRPLLSRGRGLLQSTVALVSPWVTERNVQGLSLHRESSGLPVESCPGANQLPNILARFDER